MRCCWNLKLLLTSHQVELIWVCGHPIIWAPSLKMQQKRKFTSMTVRTMTEGSDIFLMPNSSSIFTCSTVTFLASSSLLACSVSRLIFEVVDSLTVMQRMYKSTTLVIYCKCTHYHIGHALTRILSCGQLFLGSAKNGYVTLIFIGREWWKYEAFTCWCHFNRNTQISHSRAGTICFQLVERKSHIPCGFHSGTYDT